MPKIVAGVVQNIYSNLIEVQLVDSGQPMAVHERDTKAYHVGDLVTVDTEKFQIVDEAENYPFI